MLPLRGCPRNCDRRGRAKRHCGQCAAGRRRALLTRKPGDLPSQPVTRRRRGGKEMLMIPLFPFGGARLRARAWNPAIEKNSLEIKNLEHVLTGRPLRAFPEHALTDNQLASSAKRSRMTSNCVRWSTHEDAALRRWDIILPLRPS